MDAWMQAVRQLTDAKRSLDARQYADAAKVVYAEAETRERLWQDGAENARFEGNRRLAEFFEAVGQHMTEDEIHTLIAEWTEL